MLFLLSLLTILSIISQRSNLIKEFFGNVAFDFDALYVAVTITVTFAIVKCFILALQAFAKSQILVVVQQLVENQYTVCLLNFFVIANNLISTNSSYSSFVSQLRATQPITLKRSISKTNLILSFAIIATYLIN